MIGNHDALRESRVWPDDFAPGEFDLFISQRISRWCAERSDHVVWHYADNDNRSLWIILACFHRVDLAELDEFIERQEDDGNPVAFELRWHRTQALKLFKMGNQEDVPDDEYECAISLLSSEAWPPHIETILRIKHEIEHPSGPTHALSNRADQVLKPQWLEHCRSALASGRVVEQIDDLADSDARRDEWLGISSRTLKKWAREAGVSFKAGRRKK
jgi:hypothetical protein